MKKFGLSIMILLFIAGCSLTESSDVNRSVEKTHEQMNKQQQKDAKVFVERVEAKEKATLLLTNSTIEGNPINDTIHFDGKSFTVKREAKKDDFGDGLNTIYSCEKLEEVTNGSYQLNNCSDNGELFDYYLVNINEQTDEEPPAVVIEVGGKIYTTFRGTYCWSKVDQSKCVDYAGPLQILADKKPIKVPPNGQIMFSVQSDFSPETVALFEYKHDQQTAVSMQDEGLMAPREKGIYYYSYEAKWTQSSSTNPYGNVSYAFVIEVE